MTDDPARIAGVPALKRISPATLIPPRFATSWDMSSTMMETITMKTSVARFCWRNWIIERARKTSSVQGDLSEQVELGGGQLHRYPAPPDLVTLLVKLEIGELEPW